MEHNQTQRQLVTPITPWYNFPPWHPGHAPAAPSWAVEEQQGKGKTRHEGANEAVQSPSIHPAGSETLPKCSVLQLHASYLLSQAKKEKRVVGFCPFLRCHVLKEQRSNAATRPHQRGTCWGWRTGHLSWGNLALSWGMGHSCRTWDVPSLGMRSISGTSPWYLQEAKSKEGGTE